MNANSNSIRQLFRYIDGAPQRLFGIMKENDRGGSLVTNLGWWNCGPVGVMGQNFLKLRAHFGLVLAGGFGATDKFEAEHVAKC
jgi:hypothetical protein